LIGGLKVKVLIAVVSLAAFLLPPGIQSSRAGSATWNLDPPNNYWNFATDWTPATVPNGPDDTATFRVSNTTDVLVEASNPIEVNGVVFDGGASQFIVTVFSDQFLSGFLTIGGTGITNNSGAIQTFVAELNASTQSVGVIKFINSATAGALTVFNNNESNTQFFDTASAGSGTFNNNPGDRYTGATFFFDSATAENSTVITNGSLPGSPFLGGLTTFQNEATAGNANLIAYGGLAGGIGGSILFFNDSTGGTARVQVVGNGNLDISGHNGPGVTIGSIEGSGRIYLGSNNLTVGSNNLGTTFSGTIDGSGSLTKIGIGTLVLSTPNRYTGGTIVDNGKLAADNIVGSATGTGPVQVNTGTFGGRGTIVGAVTVGTGSGLGAILTPEKTTGAPDVLTIQSALTFNSDAIYEVGLKTKGAIAGKTVANGVTIQSGASFSFVVHQHRVLRSGTLFTVLENTAATPIAGAFSNLPDGSTFTVGLNTYKVSYEGGDGNDLTLTVE
jgi:autotransporter-associated beta strand protein